jgi:hypothetical protein
VTPRRWLFAGYTVVAASSLAMYIVLALGEGDAWGVVAWSGYPIVGWLILRSHQTHGVGLVMLGIGAVWALAFLPHVAAAWSENVWFDLLGSAAGYQAWSLMMMLVVLFPSGRPVTRLGRATFASIVILMAFVGLMSVVGPAASESGQTNPLAVPALGPFSDWLFGDGFFVVPLLIGLCFVDLARRWRRSDGVERLQMRWLGWAVMLILIAFPAAEFIEIDYRFLAATLNVVPAAIGIAITRHGLYEIDRLLSRSVSYLIVTGAVLATYALVVTSVTRLLGLSSTVAVAAATLAAAGILQPVLRGVRDRVDRRFNRSRYDGQQTLEGFAARLRDEVDPDGARAALLGAIERTLQPASVSVWTSGPATGPRRS